MRASAAMSNADVASSNTTKRGRFTNNRPKARRCCSPSDSMLLQSSVVYSPAMGSPSPARDATPIRSTADNTAWFSPVKTLIGSALPVIALSQAFIGNFEEQEQ